MCICYHELSCPRRKSTESKCGCTLLSCCVLFTTQSTAIPQVISNQFGLCILTPSQDSALSLPTDWTPEQVGSTMAEGDVHSRRSAAVAAEAVATWESEFGRAPTGKKPLSLLESHEIVPYFVGVSSLN